MEGQGGTFRFADGTLYVGGFAGGLFHGTGTLTSALGTYTGHFEAGKKHGRGEFKEYDGSMYLGEFALDQKHGQGKLVLPSGEVSLSVVGQSVDRWGQLFV